MTPAQAETKIYNFDKFITWYPENSKVRYKLHNGVIIFDGVIIFVTSFSSAGKSSFRRRCFTLVSFKS